MTLPRYLGESFAVSPQIAPEDVAGLRQQGFVAIINNRPDGEEPGQPSGGEIEKAAAAEGLAYHALPVSGGVSDTDVAKTAEVLDGAAGPVFAFCRTGTRSTMLWALARASRGEDPANIAEAAAAAGYDIAPVRAAVERLSSTS